MIEWKVLGYSRNVEVHWLIAFAVGAMFHKTRISALDLDTTSSFLLDVLYVGASMTHYLCSQVKAWDWLQVDGYPLFWPFALQTMLELPYLQGCSRRHAHAQIHLVPLGPALYV